MLRLRAEDAEDLKVISACLQDSLVMVGDMAYLAEEQRFILVANRFVWEAGPQQDEGTQVTFERTNAGLTFEGVTAVTKHGIDRRHADDMVSLLAVQALPSGIELTFSNDRAIRLDMPEIKAALQDLGDPWPTLWRPRHEDGGA